MHDTLTMALSLEGELLDGDPFDRAHELARILRAQADRIAFGQLDGLLAGAADQLPVRDLNGNTVGAWCYRPHTATEAQPQPQVQADPWNLWLGDINAVPWADLLDALPAIGAVGQSADLKVEATIAGTTLRVWLSRCDVASGEPFARTVYVEQFTADGGPDGGRWADVGHYDGDQQGLAPTERWAAEALNITRQLCQPDPEQ